MSQWMRFILCFVALSVQMTPAVQAAPDPELVYRLKGSIAKVHVVTKKGGHGVGSAVVVAKDMVATNCHIVANASGVKITARGNSAIPVSLKADWAHDVCLLKFKYLNLTPAPLGDSDALAYEQEIFSIGFPGGPPKPLTTYGYIKALYPLDDAQIIRTSASFILGASGSPVFNQQGELIGISTFKSPGRRNAFFYNVPVKWIKRLLDSPDETESLASDTSQFWDAPPEKMPYFMRVVHPYQHEAWPTLEGIASEWVAKEKDNAEPYYYLGVALANQNKAGAAKEAFEQAIKIEPRHSGSIMALGLLANKQGDEASVEKAHQALQQIQPLLDEDFSALLNVTQEPEK